MTNLFVKSLLVRAGGSASFSRFSSRGLRFSISFWSVSMRASVSTASVSLDPFGKRSVLMLSEMVLGPGLVVQRTLTRAFHAKDGCGRVGFELL
jgi:hypothetical protein